MLQKLKNYFQNNFHLIHVLILKIKILISFIILFVSIQTTVAQLYNYKQYTVADGFPQSNADDIFQDKDGYIWFATQNGAARFDGFNYFLIDKYKGLNSNNVTDINQDSEGNFWFSTKDGLTKYVNDSCINYTVEDGLFSNIVRNTFELSDGRIIICSTSGSSIYENNEIKKLHLKDVPNYFIKTHNGEIWCISNTDIYKFENDTLHKIEYNIKKIKLHYLVEDRDSALWISSDNGIYKIAHNRVSHLSVNDGLISDDVRALLIDSDNNLWYASERKGCGKYFNGKFYNLTAETGMTNTAVLSLFEDKEKNIWIGGRNGATMINPRIPFIQFENLSSYKNEIVMGISEDKYEHLWFCTYGSGLSEYDGKTFKNHNKSNGAYDNHFFDVETDEKGNLWLATGNNGILIYNYKKFKRISDVEGKKITSRVLTIFKDSEKNLWFGTNGEGVIKFNGNKLTRFNDLKAKNILTINEDNAGNIWFGTLNEGIFMFNGDIIQRIDNNNSIISGEIRSIANIKGNLWFGTASEGIYTLKKNNTGFTQHYFNKSTGLNSDNIYLLFVDSKDNLWCGTEKGVDRIQFDKNGNINNIKNYTKNEGFLGVETDLNGAYEDKNGNIWFGTIFGALKFLPNITDKNIIEPTTYIKNIKLNFKDFDWSNYCDSFTDKGLPINLILPHDMNHLTIEFISLCYSNPQKVKYKYRLKGQNKNWSPAVSDHKVVFSNIAPGNYTFEVKASNDSGVWNSEPVCFSFTIKPPVWEELWFKTIGLLLILILAYLIFDYRNRSLKKTKNKLEIKVSERTVELKKQKEKVENVNLKITDSINYAGKIQSAMMPAEEMFINNFSDSFVLYKPKDIVSGDFYWAKEVRRGYDSYIVIVAADSTGHGIPGALVSMLGMSLLNEIVRKEEIQRANMVLEELRKEIKSSLRQKGAFDDQTEGIDMAVIIINKHTKELQYSGANNPLYIIRNDEIIILTPTINPVGIFLKELPFKNNVFQLHADDVLYLFSDGYEDQFNGKTGKKFKLKQFRELLLSVHKKTGQEQKQILEDTFLEWKGNYEQIDDVLVMGLKI
ncbi:MAG: hypothetical protein DRI94_04425 [Bacteroidetes bacterium]|nr:MAG: hypothetical protein DRI94_04425 [Bacteroidota bacterium]